jgi:hypothetical protein
MHYRMLITLNAPANTDSADVRHDVFDRLINDDSFCGAGGRFGAPLCDWFVIGGRWSGLLAENAIGAAYKDAVRARFPQLAREWWPESIVDEYAAELDAIWQAHGGSGPSPYTRSGYDRLGYPDDAVILTSRLYEGLLSEYEGQSLSGDGYADLDDEELDPDFVGRKWLVLIDYHN